MTRTSIFVDTSGWGELADPSQAYHQLMVSLYTQALRQRRRLVTSNYVLAELVALMTSPLRFPRPAVVAFVQSIKASVDVEVVHVDVDLDLRAWRLLEQRLDKPWSLVDCASFVIMQQRGLTDALTTDHHFEQAGFTRLLR